jgi:hypothetical protein
MIVIVIVIIMFVFVCERERAGWHCNSTYCAAWPHKMLNVKKQAWCRFGGNTQGLQEDETHSTY